MPIDPRARAWGIAAETAVRAALVRLGYFVVPAHAIEQGGAPMLIGLLEKHVLPDFLVARAGMSRWVEVKFKDHCVKFGKTGYFRHGIDLPNWYAYREVEKITGVPGHLAVLQYRPGANVDPDPHLLMQSFAHLHEVIDFQPDPIPTAPRGMAYWNVDEMNTITRLDFNFTDVERLTKVIHPWEARTKSGDAPQADMKFGQRELHYRRKVGEA